MGHFLPLLLQQHLIWASQKATHYAETFLNIRVAKIVHLTLLHNVKQKW
jgi:hypothetical protein